MKHRLVIATLFISLWLPCTASAGDTTSTTTPPAPTPQEIAQARAEADAAIAGKKVEDLFENITEGNIPSVRHRLSGLVCRTDPGHALSLHAYDGLPRGDDVSCGHTVLGITETLYATRYPSRPTARQVVEGSFAAIRQNFTDVKNYTGTGVSIERDDDEDRPQIINARLEAKIEGRPVFTKSSAVVLGDWVIAQRVTGPIDKAGAADLMSALTLNRIVDEHLKPGAKAE